MARFIADSFFEIAGYSRRRGDLQYDGERPGPEWHAHGYFPRFLHVLQGGRLVRRRLWKRRWKATIDGQRCTRHSRPPNDVPFARACTLVLVLKLWALLVSERGQESYEELTPTLDSAGSRRTVRRWLRRALPRAMATQQVLRRVVIERSEPRPMEALFPGGLPPPEGLRRRHWRDPHRVEELQRGLAIVLRGAVALEVPVPVLLAEARGRQATQTPFLI